MKYAYLEKRNTLDDLYSELRINFIRVNNNFCAKIYDGNEQYALDIFAMFDDPTVDLGTITNLALCMEGTAEAMENKSEVQHLETLLRLSQALKSEMDKLP